MRGRRCRRRGESGFRRRALRLDGCGRRFRSRDSRAQVVDALGGCGGVQNAGAALRTHLLRRFRRIGRCSFPGRLGLPQRLLQPRHRRTVDLVARLHRSQPLVQLPPLRVEGRDVGAQPLGRDRCLAHRRLQLHDLRRVRLRITVSRRLQRPVTVLRHGQLLLQRAQLLAAAAQLRGDARQVASGCLQAVRALVGQRDRSRRAVLRRRQLGCERLRLLLLRGRRCRRRGESGFRHRALRLDGCGRRLHRRESSAKVVDALGGFGGVLNASCLTAFFHGAQFFRQKCPLLCRGLQITSGTMDRLLGSS